MMQIWTPGNLKRKRKPLLAGCGDLFDKSVIFGVPQIWIPKFNFAGGRRRCCSSGEIVCECECDIFQDGLAPCCFSAYISSGSTYYLGDLAQSGYYDCYWRGYSSATDSQVLRFYQSGSDYYAELTIYSGANTCVFTKSFGTTQPSCDMGSFVMEWSSGATCSGETVTVTKSNHSDCISGYTTCCAGESPPMFVELTVNGIENGECTDSPGCELLNGNFLCRGSGCGWQHW